MPRICLWGTSLKKPADEIQVEAMAKITATQLPGVEVTVFSRDADAIVSRYPHLRAIDPRNLPAIARALSRADLFVFVGGPFFEEVRQAAAITILLGMAKVFRVPVIAYGATIFRTQSGWGRQFYRAVFRRFDKIGVRERVGREHLDLLGHRGEVEVYADPRFVLRPAPRKEVDELLAAEGIRLDRPRVAVTTRQMHARMPRWVKRTHAYADAHVARTAQGLALAIERISAEAQVFCIPQHSDYADDVATVERIRAHMRNPSTLRLLSRRYTALQTVGLIAHSDMVLACRFGSTVFACMTATPVVAISHEPRTADHMDRVGMRDCVFEWTSLDPEAFAARVAEVWRDRESVRVRAGAFAEAMEELAWKNSEVLQAYV